MTLDKEVLNQNADNVNRLQFTVFEKVQQESDGLRKELAVCNQNGEIIES